MKLRLAATALIIAACMCAGLIAGCGGGGGGEPFTLAGTVTNASGAPVSGALVTATVSGHTQPVDSTATSSNGVFGLVAPPGTYVVEASATGFVTQQKTVTITATQPNLSISIVLSAVSPPPPPPANLGGRVTNSVTSAPVGGATVTATLQGQVTPIGTTTTNSDGRYGFWLAAGTYTINVTPLGFAPGQKTVTLPVGGSLLNVDFALTPT